MVLHNPEQIAGITYNKSVHLPFALHHIHNRRMQDNRHTVDRIVGGHHRLGAAFLEGRLKGFQIIFAHITRINAG
ncbi:hypothetical protein D3C86_1939770 [compost metagenome]